MHLRPGLAETPAFAGVTQLAYIRKARVATAERPGPGTK